MTGLESSASRSSGLKNFGKKSSKLRSSANALLRQQLLSILMWTFGKNMHAASHGTVCDGHFATEYEICSAMIEGSSNSGEPHYFGASGSAKLIRIRQLTVRPSVCPESSVST